MGISFTQIHKVINEIKYNFSNMQKHTKFNT